MGKHGVQASNPSVRERWEDLQLKDVLGYTGNSKPA